MVVYLDITSPQAAVLFVSNGPPGRVVEVVNRRPGKGWYDHVGSILDKAGSYRLLDGSEWVEVTREELVELLVEAFGVRSPERLAG